LGAWDKSAMAGAMLDVVLAIHKDGGVARTTGGAAVVGGCVASR
jgi:hypothetical protein